MGTDSFLFPKTMGDSISGRVVTVIFGDPVENVGFGLDGVLNFDRAGRCSRLYGVSMARNSPKPCLDAGLDNRRATRIRQRAGVGFGRGGEVSSLEAFVFGERPGNSGRLLQTLRTAAGALQA